MRIRLPHSLLCLLAGTAVTLALGACTMTPQATIASGAEGRTEAVPNALLRAADAAMERRDYATAASLYRQAHQMRLERIEPLIGLGHALSGAGAPQEAAEAYRGALKLAPRNPEALRSLANAMVALNQPELALPYYRDALAEDPTNFRIYMGLGVATDLMGQHEAAQTHYRAALAMAPDDLDVLSNLGLSQALSMDLDGAIETLRQVTRDPRASARHRQNLALVYGLAGRNEEAARIARLDLDEETVRRNIAYFATLRAIDDPSRRLAAIRAYQDQQRF